jgi:hypothetical protein
MSNTLLNIDMITRSAVALFKNTNYYMQSLNTQYDSMFAIDGAKIGDSVRIRLPNDYVVTDGPALSAQDTVEQKTTLTLAYQRHVDLSFSSKEKTLNIQDYEDIFLAPAMNNLAGNVAAEVMSGAEAGVCNFVANTSGTGAIIAPTSEQVLAARAALGFNSAPTMNRKIALDMLTMSRLTNSLSGLFNPATSISKQYTNGLVGNALGFDWMEDQTVLVHTTGTFTAGTVSGAGQSGTTLTTNAISGTLKKGDIITIADVYAVNRVTKATTGQLRQFVVTANVASGATSIPIYPAIIASSGGSAVQYQTVVNAPANAAAISLVNTASEQYRRSLAFTGDAITMGMADLVAPPNREVSRKNKDGIALRILTDYVVGTDQLVTRVDALFGYTYLRPEWLVVVADKL